MSETGTQVVTEELVALRTAFVETATRFSGRDVLSRVSALDTATLVVDEYTSLRASLAEAGLIGMLAPESTGGMGMDTGSAGLVLARIAEICAGTATLMWAHESALLALSAAAACGDSVLADVGEELLGNGLVSSHALNAVPDAEGWRLDGSAGFVWGAGVATHYVVAASTRDGGIVALVPASAPGLRIREQHVRIGLRACPSAAIDFSNVPVEQAIAITGPEYESTIAVARQQSLGLIGAIAAGNARGAWRAALQYARERYQGGAIIIEHSLVQGMLGKSLAEIRAAESIVSAGLSLGGDDALLAKVVATRNGEQVCLDAMQVFGGNGYMRDYGIEKRLRDAKMLCLVGGNNERLLQGVIASHRNEGDWQ